MKKKVWFSDNTEAISQRSETFDPNRKALGLASYFAFELNVL